MSFFQSSQLDRIVPAEERRFLWWALILGLLLVVLDQYSKYWVVKSIPFGSRVPVISGFFNLTYITNTGAAWGILSGRGWFLLLISILVMLSAIWFLRSLTDGWAERYFAIFLVISGIVGNSIDRIFRGAVVDFLQFYVGKYVWPSFNVADSCICVGVILFILSTLFRPEHRKTDPDSPVYVQYKK
ncbi:MAG: Lipoprotein signal peptidase [Lentisphaerae bacterium ADurb.Bin242]|nr:MAG: Lipoprotein signal peptidase [Lentisphaerae bacterium ADurb.Bin242]